MNQSIKLRAEWSYFFVVQLQDLPEQHYLFILEVVFGGWPTAIGRARLGRSLFQSHG